MRSHWIVAAGMLIALPFAAGELRAGPIDGTQVTGSLVFGSSGNAFVPGSLNAKTATVSISATQMEFGYADNSNTFKVDFSGTQLTVTDQTLSGSGTFTMTFQDDAFLGATLTNTQDSFITGTNQILVGTLAGSLDGTTITLMYPGTGKARVNSVTFSAGFDLTLAAAPASDPPPPAPVPEPLSLTIFGIAGAAVVLRYARKRCRFI